MKYRVHKDTTTGRALTELAEQMRAADKAAHAWLVEKGFSRDVVLDTVRVAGGLAGIAFAEKPKDWKLVFEFNQSRYYFPMENRVSVRAILKEMRALPQVRVFEYNRVIQWDGFLSKYGLADRGDNWLLDVPDARDVEAPAASDLVEITTVEYKVLLGPEQPVKTPVPSHA